MATSYGKNINMTVFGGSHDPEIGVRVTGLPKGFAPDREALLAFMKRRAPGQNSLSTPRKETDEPIFLGGLNDDGTLSGEELVAVIRNQNQRSADYAQSSFIPRPSHADFAARMKYGESVDLRGGGHFSGRLTAALVAAGAIVIPALRQKGIYIGTCINQIDRIGISDVPTDREGLLAVAESDYGLTDDYAIAMMKDTIEHAASEGDSVGGVLETAIIGLPAGLGEPWFDGVESQIACAVFGIPAVKSVAFGAKDIETMRGSRANDAFIVKNGEIVTATNNSGGIQGGITNGMPVIFRTAIKPTPSISQNQLTVNMQTREETVLSVKGRHDPCIVPRARIVIDSVAALVVADMLTVRYGSDALVTK